MTSSVAATPTLARAPAQRVAELEVRVQAMARKVARLREELDKNKQQNASPRANGRVEALTASEVAQRAAANAGEWKSTATVTHLAGYTDQKNGTNAFDLVTFNSIFHFQYKDRMLLESEQRETSRKTA